jgi:predicted negative regulator of RcsB-dependent stress response
LETYDTEEEQIEALRRWWDENGRSIILAVVVALSAGFGWQAWKSYDQESIESASNLYQAMLQNMNVDDSTPEQEAAASRLAVQLKGEYAGSSYAQFAALHLASMAVSDGDLAKAEGELRWVLSKADKGGDIAQVTELRLARVVAAAGRADQALEILQRAGTENYAASYAMARGDVLLQLQRVDEARDAYADARALAGQGGAQFNLATLDQKIQSLNPRPARIVESGDIEVSDSAGENSASAETLEPEPTANIEEQ